MTKNEMVYGFIFHEEVQRGLIKFELFFKLSDTRNKVIGESKLY